MREVNKVLYSGNEAQQKVAMQTLHDLTTMMMAHNAVSAEGRTALLTGLIAELTQVVESVRVSAPYANAIGGLTTIIDGTRKRLEGELETLIPSGT
jgi:hypothetical protein